jgi:glycosyltransferase involved in cell wall biosynthesis
MDTVACLHIAFVTSIHKDFDARVWRYAVMMARRGHTVHLVCPWQVSEGETRDGVTLHPFPRARRRLARPVSIPWHLARKLWPLVRAVDVVHFHDIDTLPYMAALALFKPVVYDVHENYPEEMLVRQWIPRPFRLLLYHGVRWIQAGLSLLIRNVVLVVPEQQKDFPMRALRTVIIRNYATLDLLERVSPDYRSRRATVVFIGLNYEENGTFLFLEIATHMLHRRPDVRFVMADCWADDSTRERSLALIQACHLTNVTIVPNVLPQDVIGHLNQATIGISPALRRPKCIRGLPTKLFEYMAAGLPIVASDLPHSIRLAEQTGAVLLCCPEKPETFVAAIEHLLDDREYGRQLGQNGQNAFKERFCWESQADVLEHFYSDILGRDVTRSTAAAGIAVTQ